MQISQPMKTEAAPLKDRAFSFTLDKEAKPRSSKFFGDAGKQPSAYSSGGLEAPDGNTRDPFPPSLIAYIEVLRAVTEYLRSQGMISGGPQTSPATEVTGKRAENTPADEPTTFAIGEEDHDCAAPTPTPAIGEPART